MYKSCLRILTGTILLNQKFKKKSINCLLKKKLVPPQEVFSIWGIKIIIVIGKTTVNGAHLNE